MKEDERPTVIDICSGVGGFSRGFELAGFRVIGHAEIEPYACAVLRRHFPGVRNYGDLRNIPRGLRADVVVGGPPCQSASVAGKQRGPEDDRWLWQEAIAVVERVRPTFVLFENPTGILTLNGGVEFERVLSGMESIGYAVQPVIVPACAVDAKHRRDRVWIIGHQSVAHARSGDWREGTPEWRGASWAGARDESGGSGHNTQLVADADGAQRGEGDETGGCAEQGQHGEGQAAGRVGECGETLAHAHGAGWQEQCGTEPIREELLPVERGGGPVSDTGCGGGQGEGDGECGGAEQVGGQLIAQFRGVVDDVSKGLDEDRAQFREEWEGVPRISTGIRDRSKRLRCLGNAVVPHVVAMFAKAIYPLLRP